MLLGKIRENQPYIYIYIYMGELHQIVTVVKKIGFYNFWDIYIN